MRRTSLLKVIAALGLAFGLSGCSGDGESPRPAVTPEPTFAPVPAAQMPAPVPFEIPANLAILGTPDEAVSRVAMSNLQSGGMVILGLDTLLVPLAGVNESILIIELEKNRSPDPRNDDGDLKGLQRLVDVSSFQPFNLTRVVLTYRQDARVLSSTSVSLATLKSRVNNTPVAPGLLLAIFADEPGAANDPAVQAAKMASSIYEGKILGERVRSQVLVTPDASGMDRAIEFQPYNVKFLLEKAQMQASNGESSERTKGQALYVLQQQAINGNLPTPALGPRTPEFVFVLKYAAQVLERALGVKSYDQPPL